MAVCVVGASGLGPWSADGTNQLHSSHSETEEIYDAEYPFFKNPSFRMVIDFLAHFYPCSLHIFSTNSSQVPPPEVVACSNAPRRCAGTQFSRPLTSLYIRILFALPVVGLEILPSSFPAVHTSRYLLTSVYSYACGLCPNFSVQRSILYLPL